MLGRGQCGTSIRTFPGVVFGQGQCGTSAICGIQLFSSVRTNSVFSRETKIYGMLRVDMEDLYFSLLITFWMSRDMIKF